MDSPALVPISKVVHSYLNATGIYSKVNYKRFLQIVLENYADLNINNTAGFNSGRFIINQVNCVPFPLDYIDYVRIGVPVAGQIETLTANDAIITPKAITCGVEVADSDLSTPISNDWIVHYGSTGGRNFMYYKSDKINRQIVFEGDGIGREVVIQYITTGINMSGATMIPVELVKVLRKYLHWVYMDFDMLNKFPQNKIEAARRDFYHFLNEFERQELSFTAEEFIDAIRQGYKQTIKG